MCCLQDTHFRPIDTNRMKVEWKIYSMKMEAGKKIHVLKSEKIDLKQKTVKRAIM